MIVLIAGMPRSGSTFSFNVVREILLARGSVYQESCEDVIGAVGRSGGTDHQTFFHRRHVSHLQSRPAEQRLSPERLKMIRAALAAAIAVAGLPIG